MDFPKKRFIDYFYGDGLIWIIVIGLILFGIVEIFSTTAMLSYKFQHGNSTYYIMKHCFNVIVGLGIMYFLSRFSYKFIDKAAKSIYWCSIILLILTLFFGDSTNDAKRWISIPMIGLQFQTSDLAKVALTLILAKNLSKTKESSEIKRKQFWICIGQIALVCALIMPANMSTAVLIGFTSLIVLLVGQMPFKWVATAVLIMVLAGGAFIGLLQLAGSHTRLNTWKNRIETYVSGDNKDDFQAEQSKIAIASGGVLGRGPGRSLQRNVLPHPYSDFIFAILVEELGLWGCGLVLLAYLTFFYRAVTIVKGLERSFPAFIVVGLSLNIVLQALSNLLVATNIFPVTGQPLPFVSMGGSSMLFSSISVGIILNISRYASNKETVEAIEEDMKTDEVDDYPFIAG